MSKEGLEKNYLYGRIPEGKSEPNRNENLTFGALLEIQKKIENARLKAKKDKRIHKEKSLEKLRKQAEKRPFQFGRIEMGKSSPDANEYPDLSEVIEANEAYRKRKRQAKVEERFSRKNNGLITGSEMLSDLDKIYNEQFNEDYEQKRFLRENGLITGSEMLSDLDKIYNDIFSESPDLIDQLKDAINDLSKNFADNNLSKVIALLEEMIVYNEKVNQNQKKIDVNSCVEFFVYPLFKRASDYYEKNIVSNNLSDPKSIVTAYRQLALHEAQIDTLIKFIRAKNITPSLRKQLIETINKYLTSKAYLKASTAYEARTEELNTKAAQLLSIIKSPIRKSPIQEGQIQDFLNLLEEMALHQDAAATADLKTNSVQAWLEVFNKLVFSLVKHLHEQFKTQTSTNNRADLIQAIIDANTVSKAIEQHNKTSRVGKALHELKKDYQNDENKSEYDYLIKPALHKPALDMVSDSLKKQVCTKLLAVINQKDHKFIKKMLKNWFDLDQENNSGTKENLTAVIKLLDTETPEKNTLNNLKKIVPESEVNRIDGAKTANMLILRFVILTLKEKNLPKVPDKHETDKQKQYTKRSKRFDQAEEDLLHFIDKMQNHKQVKLFSCELQDWIALFLTQSTDLKITEPLGTSISQAQLPPQTPQTEIAAERVRLLNRYVAFKGRENSEKQALELLQTVSCKDLNSDPVLNLCTNDTKRLIAETAVSHAKVVYSDQQQILQENANPASSLTPKEFLEFIKTYITTTDWGYRLGYVKIRLGHSDEYKAVPKTMAKIIEGINKAKLNTTSYGINKGGADENKIWSDTLKAVMNKASDASKKNYQGFFDSVFRRRRLKNVQEFYIAMQKAHESIAENSQSENATITKVQVASPAA